MPKIMTLDGPALGNLAEIRSKLYLDHHRSWWQTPTQLGGLLDPMKANPWWVAGGVILGAWLAGSATGKKLIRRK